MKERLAILGANEAITMLINKAKQLGYETHVFAWKCGAPGETAADYFYPISIADKDTILEKCKEIGICGICSITSDFAAPVASYVARNMGLPGNSERTDIASRNKYEMRKVFERAGIYTPKYMSTDGHIQKQRFEGFTFPLIVKPTDAWSSKGITKVEDFENLQSAVEIARSFSSEKKAIVEEFLDGPEYSAECIVYNEEVFVLAFTQKETTGSPNFIEIGHTQPADLTEKDKEYATERVVQAVKALGISNSAAHAEFRILKSGEIGFMEIGSRMGGDNIGTYLTPISTGMDYIRMVIDVACGRKPDFSIKNKPEKVSTRFIISEKDKADFYKLKAEDEASVVCYEIDEDCSANVTNSNDRHGYYVIKEA